MKISDLIHQLVQHCQAESPTGNCSECLQDVASRKKYSKFIEDTSAEIFAAFVDYAVQQETEMKHVEFGPSDRRRAELHKEDHANLIEKLRLIIRNDTHTSASETVTALAQVWFGLFEFHVATHDMAYLDFLATEIQLD